MQSGHRQFWAFNFPDLLGRKYRGLLAAALAGWTLCGSAALADKAERARPNGLDGLNVVQTPTPAPLDYFDRSAKAIALVAEGKFADAEALTDELAAQYPFDGRNWLRVGRTKRALGKFAEAAEGYRKAMALLGPGVPGMAEYWLAVSQVADGKRDAALDTLDHLLAEDHYLGKTTLASNDNFKTLKSLPRFGQLAGEPPTPAQSRDEGWRGDIGYLRAEVKRVNPDYHDRPLPAAFETSYRTLRTGVPQLSDEEIYVGMSRMLATLNQGHTNLWPGPGTKMAFRALPMQFYLFPEGIFIVAAPGAPDLVGAQLIAIEQTPANEALRRIGDIHASDSGMEIAWQGPQYLALAQELKGLGIVSNLERVQITVRQTSGAVVSRTVSTMPSGNTNKLPPASGAPPLAFSHPGKAHWFEKMEADNASLFVQVNQIQDDPDETLAAFGVRLRRVLDDGGAKNIILDLRNNNGGNTYTYVELLRTLISFSTQQGHTLYVLIGRDTYSAAGNLITDLERLAAPIFVGEPAGMTGNNYGDENHLILPYSGISAGVTSLKWQLGYPSDARRTIVPQLPVALTAVDYFAGRDPALDTIRALIAREAKASRTP